MDAEVEKRFCAWLNREGIRPGCYSATSLTARAFEAGVKVAEELRGEPVAYCVFNFRTMLLKGCQGKEQAEWHADYWNKHFGASVHECDRAFVQPVFVLEARATEPGPDLVDTGEEGKGSD